MNMDVEDLRVEIGQMFQEECLELRVILDHYYLGKGCYVHSGVPKNTTSYVFETSFGFELVIYEQNDYFSIHAIGPDLDKNRLPLYWPLEEHLLGLSTHWPRGSHINSSPTSIVFEELKSVIRGDRMCLRSLGCLV